MLLAGSLAVGAQSFGYAAGYVGSNETWVGPVEEITPTPTPEPTNAPAVKPLKLNKTTLSLKYSKTDKTVKVQNIPKGDAIKSVSTSSKKIATVSINKKTGLLTIKSKKKAGTATITVKMKSKKQLKLQVKVLKPVATKSLDNLPKSLTMKKGAKSKLNPLTKPAKTDDKITYSSSKKSVVTVDK